MNKLIDELHGLNEEQRKGVEEREELRQQFSDLLDRLPEDDEWTIRNFFGMFSHIVQKNVRNGVRGMSILRDFEAEGQSDESVKEINSDVIEAEKQIVKDWAEKIRKNISKK